MELSENAIAVAKSRYFIDENEDWKGLCERVATAIADNEDEENKDYWKEKFYDMLYNQKGLGGGRILRNAGKQKPKLLNCHVIPMEDDIKSIGEFIKKALVLCAEGGGCGTRPILRPKGAEIKTKGGKSSGLLSFLKPISAVLDTIESGGNRRSGILPIVDVSHPEIVDIINAKLDKNEMNNFNISIGVTNDFLDAVEKNEKWVFEFDGEEYGSIQANDLFDLIVKNQLESGEPGIINIDNMKINNSFYFSEIYANNLCSELPLSKNQSCCLGSLVLPNFLNGSRMDWESFRKTIHVMVRFLDNVLDVNDYTFQDMCDATMSCRRIGIGLLGVGSFLFKKKVRYGSDEAIAKIEHIVKFMRNEIYTASVELARERGAFPGFNNWSYLNAKFIKKLPSKIRLGIKEFGIRNCTGMAFAPGGTISLISDVTSGIEPLPMKAYIRKDKVGDRIYIHPLYKEFIEKGENIPDWFVDSLDLTPEEHFETMVAIQQLNDSSISKTIILPKGTTPDQLKDWLLEYARKLVGITVYVDGSREGQILNKMTYKEVKEYLESEKQYKSNLDEEDVKCHRGSCDI